MTTTKPKAKPRPKPKAPPAPSEPPAVSPVESEPVVGTQDPLPGLEDVNGATVPYLEVGVRRTIAALYAMGNVQEHHAAHTAAAVELARIIDAKKNSGRMSTIGNDMRAMIELLDRIVPEKSEMDATLKAAMDEWATAHAAAEPWTTPPP